MFSVYFISKKCVTLSFYYYKPINWCKYATGTEPSRFYATFNIGRNHKSNRGIVKISRFEILRRAFRECISGHNSCTSGEFSAKRGGGAKRARERCVSTEHNVLTQSDFDFRFQISLSSQHFRLEELEYGQVRSINTVKVKLQTGFIHL